MPRRSSGHTRVDSGLLVTDSALVVVGTLPALTLGAGAVALLSTRARVAAVCSLACALGTLLAIAAWAAGHDTAAHHLMYGALALGGALALLTYPSLRWRHPVDFCAMVLVIGAGVLGTVYTERGEFTGTMLLVSAVTVIAHVWWRFEVSDEEDRLALLWTSLAICTSGIVFGHSSFLTTQGASIVIGSVLFASIGPAMAIGVRRPRVVDVRALIVQVLVLGTVVIVYIAIFVGAVAALDMLGQPTPSTGVHAVLGAAVAATFHPLRVVLRGVLDEMLFGDRPDPLDAATRVADRIGDDPVLALRAIREALVLPYASISVDGSELASSGTPVTYVRRLPLHLGGDMVGEIVVGLRPGDLGLSADDADVLRIVAPLLAQTLRARELAEQVQASRGQAIASIEEERRRLRRDLHDGLGPTLSGIAFTADAARNTLHDEPAVADDLLRRLRTEAGLAVGEIRRLVYDMRPPALDELGLVPALRQRAAGVRAASGQAMRIELEAPTTLPELSAAVEAAAYRIVLEALTNAARHSGADSAQVLIEVEAGCLAVTVRDAGVSHGEWTPGVGFASMRERALELGGTLTVDRGEEGAWVRAVLPLA